MGLFYTDRPNSAFSDTQTRRKSSVLWPFWLLRRLRSLSTIVLKGSALHWMETKRYLDDQAVNNSNSAVQHLAIARCQWLRQERARTACVCQSCDVTCLVARSGRLVLFFNLGGALINFSSLDTHYSVNVFKLAPYSARLRHISILTVMCPCNVFLRYSVTIIPVF